MMPHMCAHIIGMMSWTDCLQVDFGCCFGVEPLFREGRADRVHPRSGVLSVHPRESLEVRCRHRSGWAGIRLGRE